MPLSLQNIGDAGADPIWVSRIKGSVLQSCITIMGEAAGVANHALRVILAINILREPDRYASRLACVVAGMPGPAAAASLVAVTDTQINTAMALVVDSYAVNSI
jgi:hypothetical protein